MQRQTIRHARLAILTAAILVGVGAANASGATATTRPRQQAQSTTYLNGITIIGPDDAWAVGDTGDGARQIVDAEHWNGTTWTRIRFPQEPRLTPGLGAVGASGASDVWAIGTHDAPGGGNAALTAHWNGTAWMHVRVPMPRGVTRMVFPQGLSVAAPDDAWIVGDGLAPWVLHWDGRRWHRVSFPTYGYGAILYSVSALASDDVWVSGAVNHNGTQASLIAHWDGSSWTRLTTPSPPHVLATLRGIEMTSASDGFAVGSVSDPAHDAGHALALHWDGRSWTRTSLPFDGGGAFTGLTDVSASSPTNVWAVGRALGREVVLRWDGTSWTSKSLPPGTGRLQSVSAYGPNLVGVSGSTTSRQGLHAIWNGHSWTE